MYINVSSIILSPKFPVLDIIVDVYPKDAVIVIFESKTIWQVGNKPYFGKVPQTSGGE